MEAKIIGPRLSDAEFFSELDLKIPALARAKELFDKGDVSGAYSAFADFARRFCDKEKYFSRGMRLVPEFTDSLREKAERAAAHIMVSVNVPMHFGEEIDWLANPTYNNYKEWTWQLSRHPEIFFLAEAYRACGEERYAKEAVYMLRSWIEQALCTEYDANAYHDTMTWRTIEAGLRMQVWPDIIHSIADSPYFTDEIAVMVFKSVFEHGMRLSSMYTHGNWLFIELGGMASLSSSFTFFKRSEEWRQGVMDKLTGCLAHQVYPDSSQYELAPSYQGVAMRCAEKVEQVFAERDIKFPELFYTQMKRMCDFFVKVRMADGYTPPINDSEKCNAAGAIKRYVQKYGGSEMAKWLTSGGKEGSAPDFNTAILPYAGFVAFRTGWGEEDISAFFDGGKFGRDHHHEDKLNFLLYTADGPLVYEMGTYAYDNSPMRYFATQTDGHNTVKVNGKGQNRFCEKIWREDGYLHTKEDLKYFAEGDIEYAVSSYDRKYGNPIHDGEGTQPLDLAIHTRGIIMIKGGSPKDTLFIAHDRMITRSDERDYSALWHLNVQDVTPLDRGISSPALTVLTAGFDSMEIDTGVMEPKPRGWISRTNIQGDYYAAPQLTLHRRGYCESFATLFALGSAEEIPVSGILCDERSVTVRYKNGSERVIDVAELDAKAGSR